MWETWEDYLHWLYAAYEEFKKAKYQYKHFHFYNKPYWDRRFKMEIERVEERVRVEKILGQNYVENNETDFQLKEKAGYPI